ncbi:hypothetical protein LEP1GSC071_0688 [Leptospira santarosai str. JET]|nr:hypothetical protein LEP1GSC071_0688 [Leptospira santarosai str. JET]EPG83343.1 hypothetical protein LEP1GSC048_2773 [Leptospira santarosai serovar Shermani str. 1342KT]
MDFMSDSLYSGRRFRILNVIEDYGRFSTGVLNSIRKSN